MRMRCADNCLAPPSALIHMPGVVGHGILSRVESDCVDGP